MTRLTFYGWLVAQRDRDDAIGDLARVVEVDLTFPRAARYASDVYAYFRRRRAGAKATKALHVAWGQYQRAGRKESA